MFDLDQFIADCRASLVEDATHKSVREVVARAVSDPGAVLKGLGEPQRSGIQKIYHSRDLTILNVIWGPRMFISPHNHQMWAVIGIYTGREDNVFWRRLPLEAILRVVRPEFVPATPKPNAIFPQVESQPDSSAKVRAVCVQPSMTTTKAAEDEI